MVGRLCLLAVLGLPGCAFWELSDWSDRAGDAGPDSLLALDRFERDETAGLGTSDIGGPWTLSGSADRVSVEGGAARLAPNVGETLRGVLGDPSALDVDAAMSVTVPDPPDGIGVYVSLHARVVDDSGAAAYRFQVVVTDAGETKASLKNTNNDSLVARDVVLDPPYVTGTALRMRLQVEGSGPTHLRGRLWRDSDPEPDTWTVEADDSTADLQTAGALGISAYTSSSATRPAVVTFDELVAAPLAP